MADAVDRGDAEAEGDGAEHGALPVETVNGARGMRQAAPAQRQCRDAERDVDGEQIRPGSDRQNRRGDRRADRGGDRDHQRVEADAAPEQRARVGETDQRRVDAHDPGGAKSLHDARDRQQQQRVRKRAKQRRQREEHESRQVDAAITDDFAERCQRQQRNRDRQLIAVDDPDRKRRARRSSPWRWWAARHWRWRRRSPP